MKVKGYLILANWLIVIILIFALWLVINMAVSAFYHPNSILAPYYAITPQIWGLLVTVSFLVAIVMSIFSNKLSVRGMYLIMAGAYGTLVVITAIALFQVKPVPSYFIQSVGDTKYKVPREFTTRQNRDFNVNLDLCIKTLKGIYSRDRGDCEYNRIYLSPDSSNSIQNSTLFELTNFFQKTDRFSINNNKVTPSDEAANYQISAIDGIMSYTINSDQASNKSKIAHLQINKQNELIRFVSCRQFQSNVNKCFICQHWIKTPQGILQYELKETADFDLKRWQQIESNILNLISQWKIN